VSRLSKNSRDQTDEVFALAKEVRLESLIGFALRRAHFAAENHYHKLADERRLTPRQVGVLVSLVQSGPTTIAELSERIYVDRNTVGEMITRMAKAGLIQKRTPPENRRVVEILVTRKGIDELRHSLPAIVRSQAEVLEAVPARDRPVFLRCLTLIADRFS
jgi:DNA-binding MarR family transcriptional regulator